MSGWRLPTGGLCDRSKPIRFTWGGQPYAGFAGDTLASALMANGVSIFGRSFKYHRPRGLLAAGYDEPNAIVQLGEGATTIPNRKATEVELYEGLAASAVNAWPSPELDLLSVNSLAKRFIPAAFYYKTFLWPKWSLYEPAIRKAAGLGKAPTLPDPDVYDQAFAHTDLLIVGGGVAGLTEARSAGRAGRTVLLVEADAIWGGLLDPQAVIEGRPARTWLAETLAELRSLPGVTLRNRTIATGAHDHGFMSLAERLTDHLPEARRAGPRQRLWKLRCREILFATGAIERPLVFAGNDLPGVMLASAARTYLDRFAVAPGRTLVVATTNDSGWATALAFARAGVRVAHILDARPEPACHLLEAARTAGIPVQPGTTVLKAQGPRAVSAAIPTRLDPDGRATTKGTAIPCDALLMAGGWSPVVHLHSQAGGRLRYDDGIAAFVPAEGPPGTGSAGAAAGAIAPGQRAVWHISPDPTNPPADAWVDFQNDVTAADIALAHRESFRSVEHLKRYTTLGMASDQGKTSNVNGLAIMGQLLGKAPADVGTTKFRPPYDPTTIGAYAGHRVGETAHPRRLLPAHPAHSALGAVFEEYGPWTRPAFYPQPGETEHSAVQREARAVRNAAGLFDASPLGKIEVKGPDAAAFLDRICVGTMSTLKVGQCRYGLMLDEHGIVFDDGVVARIAPDHFLVGTTSGHASAVAANLQEWLQCEWPDMRVATEDVTQCWAVMNITGPRAREVLAKLDTSIDLSAAAFSHLQHRDGTLEGVSCRIQRVSYSGELGYELAVPARHAIALHARLLEAGWGLGLTPFGIEAMMVLRAEKGFLHLGSDTDGMTQPQDIGFAGPVANKKSDFVGRRSCLRPDAQRANRRQFVGLEAQDGRQLSVGAHILPIGAQAPTLSQGWVTSSIHSPTLGRPHALAMIEAGQARMGELVQIWDLGAIATARIVPPCAYEPSGERMHG